MAKVKIDVRGFDKVKTLIELLSQYQDSLPADLKLALMELADSKEIEFRVDQFKEMAGQSVLETDFHTDRIVRVNHVLRRVAFLDEENVLSVDFPDKFRLGAGGKVLIEWGY